MPASETRTPFGVTVMPERFQFEGIDEVLDRVVAMGARAIATSPYVLEVAPDGQGGREPPPDGEAGRVRPLDRPLAGRTELWVRTAPAFVHDVARYRGLRYQPPAATRLTRQNVQLLDRVITAAKSRGLEVLLQVMAASPPGYRAQFSGAFEDDQCRRPDGSLHLDRVDRNASLASGHVRDYLVAFVVELAERYPIDGIRLDWPEAPPYDLGSALFDFHPAMRRLMQDEGHDDVAVARDVAEWVRGLRAAASRAAPEGPQAVRRALVDAGWEAWSSEDGVYQPLRSAKRRAITGLLTAVRSALGGLPGSRPRLEPQVFPPPFHRISGFPLDALEGLADRVGVKLYTMHWPMIARYWARELVGEGAPGRDVDAVTAAVAELFDLLDEPVDDGAALRYPEPDTPHPVGASAQRRKLAEAGRLAGSVPVVAFAHAYGPGEDVARRFRIACEGAPIAWLNRYGYLSDGKMRMITEAAA
jgi:hypothetical protein